MAVILANICYSRAIGWIVVVSIVSFCLHGYDKAQSQSKDPSAQRVPESVLHALTAAGGTLGSFLGMHLFRHKTAKSTFKSDFWRIAEIHLLVVALVLVHPHRS